MRGIFERGRLILFGIFAGLSVYAMVNYYNWILWLVIGWIAYSFYLNLRIETLEFEKDLLDEAIQALEEKE